MALATNRQPRDPISSADLNGIAATVNDLDFDLDGRAVNVRSAPYNALGNGVADDTSAIANAITSAVILGKKVLIPAGTYKITSTIDLPSNVAIEGEGQTSVIDMSGAVATTIGFRALGTLNAGINLTVDAAKNTFTVTVADSTGVASDDYVKISSTAMFGANPRGEFLRVRSTTSTTITFYTPLSDNYLVADTATVQKANAKQRIAVRQLKFLGPTDVTVQVEGTHFELAHTLLVADNYYEHTNYVGTAMWDVWNWRVTNCSYKDNMMAGNAYGISVGWAAQEGVISGNYGEHMRHLVTLGGGTSRRGVQRRIVVTDNTAITTDAGFDSHASSDGIVYSYNTVYGSNDDSAGTTHDGMISQGVNTKFIGNHIYGPTRHGIYLQSECLDPSTSHIVEGNYVERAGQRGILVAPLGGIGAAAPIGVTIANNVIVGVGQRAIEVDLTTVPGSNVTITGNVCKDPLGNGIYVSNITNLIIVGNVISGIAANFRGINVNACTDFIVANNVVTVTSTTGTHGIRTEASSTQGLVSGNRVKGSLTGISFDNSCTNHTYRDNDCTGCTTRFFVGTGTGHKIYSFVDPTALNNTDASFTLTPHTSAEKTVFTAVMAANRNVTLGTTNAYLGMIYRIVRTAASTGAFSLNVGTGPLKALSTGQWCEVTYDGTAWQLTAFGSL